MRENQKAQTEFCELPIAEIEVDVMSQDEVSALLLGLQSIHGERTTRQRLFVLLDENIPEVDKSTRRSGVDLWRILVIGILKQGLNNDLNWLHRLVNHDDEVRQFLGHAGGWDKDYYEIETLIDIEDLFTPELLYEINLLIVEHGNQVVGKYKKGRG